MNYVRFFRFVLALLMIVAVTAVGPLPATASAQISGDDHAQSEVNVAPTTLPDFPRQSSLPRPNSGSEPEYVGDRGTWPQYLVMGGIIGSLGSIVLLVRRESKKKLASNN